jgi:hypothetical protein
MQTKLRDQAIHNIDNMVKYYTDMFIMSDERRNEYKPAITERSIRPAGDIYNDGDLRVQITMEYTGLSEANMLRLSSRQDWAFIVSKRGKIECYHAPHFMSSDAGKKRHGVHFAKWIKREEAA